MGSVRARKKLFTVLVEVGVRREKIGMRVSSSAPSRQTAEAWADRVSILSITRWMSDMCRVENGLIGSQVQLLMAH